MQRAATEVMQSIVFSAVLDAVAALKSASGGLPNQLLRDVQAIHANVTFADLPKELQDAIAASTRSWIACRSGIVARRTTGARFGTGRDVAVPRGRTAMARPRDLAGRADPVAAPRARASRRKGSRG